MIVFERIIRDNDFISGKFPVTAEINIDSVNAAYFFRGSLIESRYGYGFIFLVNRVSNP